MVGSLIRTARKKLLIRREDEEEKIYGDDFFSLSFLFALSGKLRPRLEIYVWGLRFWE